MSIQFSRYYGERYDQLPSHFPQPINGGLTLNSPVGTVVDQYKRIWVADTGNNRILITDSDFGTLLGGLATGGPIASLNMPFRLIHHPEKPWIYVSDIGNHSVYALSYDKDLNIQVEQTFGDHGDVHISPNGIALLKVDGAWRLYVADEFYPGPEGLSRLVWFKEDSSLGGEIHEVDSDHGKLPILWPQGIDVDAQGRIYIANTGFNAVLRCDAEGHGMDFSATGTAELHGFKIPRGVSVIGQKLYVPDSTSNMIEVFDLDGHHKYKIAGYMAPIQVSKAPKQRQLLITNPITPNVVIHRESRTIAGYQPALVVDSLGGPRNNPGQFHYVAAVAHTVTPADESGAELWPWLPDALPFSWWRTWAQMQYRWWVDNSPFNWALRDAKALLWQTNPGAYQIQRWEMNGQGIADPKDDMMIPPFVGGLGLSVYDPPTSIPRQVVPGSPFFFITDFYTGTVNIYQYNSLIDQLVFYGFFGGLGTGTRQMTQPLGISINPQSGVIYVADSHNDRISRWRFNEFGQAEHLGNFGGEGEGDGQFLTPTDVALDNQGRVYVTDQFNNRVQVFTPEGEFLHAFGEEGYGGDDGKFLLPTSLCVADDHVFVNDLVNRAIKVFDLDGTFVEAFQGFGGEVGKGDMWMPFFITAHQGAVYVPDCTLNIVNVYDYQLAGNAG